MLSHTEENYLKAIFHLSENGTLEVSTNAISEALQTRPASVSDMLKKLAGKAVIDYEKYQGVRITESGRNTALQIIRKHRLWEVFLVNKLRFAWDEVHEVAEQLEHIQSALLTHRLDEFLGFPRQDPHGDPIPDESGNMNIAEQIGLNELEMSGEGIVAGVRSSTSAFLKYLDKIGISLGSKVKIVDKIPFDHSCEILIMDHQKTVTLSKEAAKNLLVKSVP